MMQNAFVLNVFLLYCLCIRPGFAETLHSSAISDGIHTNASPLQSLHIQIPGDGDTLRIAGRDARHQLVITGHHAIGHPSVPTEVDLTRLVQIHATPNGIVQIDEARFVRPIAEGTAIIHASLDGIETKVSVTVSNLKHDLPVNFVNEVVPVFTKFGCNGGGCHGKSGGQNGFRLSLLGFVPGDDYRYLVNEGRGRRLFPAAPDRSLLLEKAIGKTPHGGGARLTFDSLPYRILRRWIEQGMPFGNQDDPTIQRIDVYPPMRILPRLSEQQLSVTAIYSDGSRRDVTRMTHFESNDADLAAVTEHGLVSTQTATGSVAVMTRFQSHVDVFRAKIPLGRDVSEVPKIENVVDELVFQNLKQLGLPPSPLADDSTYLRRVMIDIAGRLPTLQETLAYLDDDSADKRSALVDRIINSPDYADYFANKWSAILRNRRSDKNIKIASYGFHNWIRESLYDNKPYDQFVSDILSATGPVRRNPPVAWFHEVKDATSQVEDTAQLFLGMRIQCAKCHHHPFEKWSQDDYYGMAAFFSRVGRKDSDLKGKQHIYHRPGKAQSRNPNSEQMLTPKPLDAEAIALTDDQDPRHRLTQWISSPDNPFFAKALVNRYWKHFFGRGLVDPEDDMRVTNPPCNPELLDALAQDFVDHKFDLKHLVRLICTSSTYALSSEPNAFNQKDKQTFSRFYPRRLNAEVLLDAIDSLTESPTKFAGVAMGTRAVQLPDNDFDSYFLSVFGRPNSASACECERSSDVNLAQCLHLLNSQEVQTKLAGNRTQQLSAATTSLETRLNELYLVAFSRYPSSEEIKVASEYLANHNTTPQQAFEDILWALMNTKEFVFNH